MTHYICLGGCGGLSEEAGICETDACANQYELLGECSCSDGKHGAKEVVYEDVLVVKDSNGTVLHDGDNVALIKDLPLRGTSTVYKRGTKVTGIRLTGNPEEVDCKLGGSAIVLRTEFLKKV